MKGDKDNFVPDDGKVSFGLPTTQKLNFEMGQQPKRKQTNIDSFLNPVPNNGFTGFDQTISRNERHRVRDDDAFYPADDDDDFYSHEIMQSSHRGNQLGSNIGMDGPAYHHSYRNAEQLSGTSLRKTRQRNSKKRNDSDDFEDELVDDDDDDDDLGDIEDDNDDFQPDD